MTVDTVVLDPVTINPVTTPGPVALPGVHATTPTSVADISTRAPVTAADVRVGAPVTLNATLGRAGLWTGEGPPTTIVGSVVGDEYLDLNSGTLYRLDPGA